MSEKEIRKLQKSIDNAEAYIKPRVSSVMWAKITELVELNIEIEQECNK